MHVHKTDICLQGMEVVCTCANFRLQSLLHLTMVRTTKNPKRLCNSGLRCVSKENELHWLVRPIWFSIDWRRGRHQIWPAISPTSRTVQNSVDLNRIIKGHWLRDTYSAFVSIQALTFSVCPRVWLLISSYWFFTEMIKRTFFREGRLCHFQKLGFIRTW